MENIVNNLEKVRAQVDEACRACGRNPEEVLLLAVSKTRTAEEINIAVQAGATELGENKVQEIMDKYDHVKGAKWHMIGHLQTNKVKYIIDKVCMIHSVDSLKLAKEIDKRAGQHGITMDILVQLNPAQEESKFGVSIDEAEGLVKDILQQCENIRVRGLMSVAPIAADPQDVKVYFDEAKKKYDELSLIEDPKLDFKYLSMGMSGDFPVAIEAGSNLVRIGSSIFGARDYSKV